MSKTYCFNARDFSVRLPWFYFDGDFSRAKPGNVWSFEVNGLTDLPKGNYDLRFCVGAPGTAPVIRSCIPDLTPVTWIQAAEWDAVLLPELIDDLEKDGNRDDRWSPTGKPVASCEGGWT